MTEKKTGYVLAVIFLLLTVRLCHLQMLQGPELKRLSEENKLRVVKLPAPRGIIYDRNSVPLVENMPYYYVSLVSDVAGEENLNDIANLLGIEKDEVIRRIKGKQPFEPIRLKEGLPFEEAAYISARLSDYPSLDVQADVMRHYPYGDVGAHVVGYLGRLSPEQAKTPEMKEVPPQAFIGQWGVERLYDEVLRGVPGERLIEVDALGRELRVVGEVQPLRGNDITLSIDLGMQAEAERALSGASGAIVALSPRSGEILALVSRPSFDPNLFARGIAYSDWRSLYEDPEHPMLNRAIQSQYPPGSVFKVVTAIAGLESRAITPETRVTCGGGLSLGSWTFGCWRKDGHGTLSLHDAIVRSCDVYFYTVGRRAGINSIAYYARELGLGLKSNLRLGDERKGFMPDELWKRQVRGQPWYLGETYNVAIGQGYVLMTPLQVARLMATVANGGYLYALTLLRQDSPPEPVDRVNISEGTLQTVRAALRGVVNEPGGTGWAARSRKVEVAGKTGTAQVRTARGRQKETGRFKEHAWFAAYAPADSPELAMVVFVEHGGGGGAVAAPIARRIIDAHFKAEAKKNE